MAHFYANALSTLLASEISPSPLQPEHFEAIRNLPSFRRSVQRLKIGLKSLIFSRFAQDQIVIGNTGMVRDLLNDDSFLFETVLEQLKQGQTAVNNMNIALEHIETIRSCMHSKADIQRSELYVKAMSGELAGSAMIRDLLLSVKKMPSDSLDELLTQISDLVGQELWDLHQQLQKLVTTMSSHGNPLRSEHDIRHETLRTTVVAQKVELSKQRSSLSKDDAAYSKIVNRVHDVLQSYFSRTFINPQSLFLHEVFIYDLKSPHRDVFTAKPRFAIERALSTPHDYLGCTCCKASDEGLSSTQPPTAILYQLYLESGALINVFDLWSAFYAIVGCEDGDDSDEQRALYVFIPLPLLLHSSTLSN